MKLHLYPDNSCAETPCTWAGSRRSVKQVNSGRAGGSAWVIHCQTARNKRLGTSLAVQWLRLCTPRAWGLDLIPGQGTRPHMLQLRVRTQQLKMPLAAAKTWHSHINKYEKKSQLTIGGNLLRRTMR